MGVPVYLNRYIGRAVDIGEYLDDLETIYNDNRYSGFDVYEFSFLEKANIEGTKLEAKNDARRLITAKAKALGLP